MPKRLWGEGKEAEDFLPEGLELREEKLEDQRDHLIRALGLSLALNVVLLIAMI